MKKKSMFLFLLLLTLMTAHWSGLAEFSFQDDRFRGKYTTENLNAIVEVYELYNGWYWTTEADVVQNYHGHSGKPGWTDTAVNVKGGVHYEQGWYGCRWGKDQINPLIPNDAGSGECFGFAQFIGYLLSGDLYPQRDWMYYDSLGNANGLRVGDIIRIEYEIKGKWYKHSAVVYAIGDGDVQFLQTSGTSYNLIRFGQGYYDGHLYNEQSIAKIGQMPGLRIYRSHGNLW